MYKNLEILKQSGLPYYDAGKRKEIPIYDIDIVEKAKA